MVRSTTLEYQFFLAGYYDDFNGARAIPNDDNNPSLTATYDHAKTHYGNPLNGEATLNTRYRWSYADRQQATSDGTSVATATNKFLKNTGPADWLTVDVSRQNSDKWEGRSQLQYPDSHNANKYRFNSSGDDGYLMFCNGHDTSGTYYVPTGDHDSSFGRDERQPYTIEYYDDGSSTNESNAGKLDNASKTGFSQRAHLTGVWMAERNYDFSHHTTGSGSATETPRLHYTPHRSPAGKPFLCIQSFQSGTTSIVETSTKRPAIAYDGLLNSRQDGDTFGLRFAVQSLNLGQLASNDPNPPKLTIQVGFPSSLNPGTEKGYIENTNTAAIEWEIDLGIATAANNGLGGTYDFSNTMTTWDGSAYDASALWIDLEFVIDYTNNRYTVYKDGTAIKNTSGASGPFTMNNNADTSAAFLPAAMKGWQIILEPGTNPNNQSHFTLMLDRVGLYQSLTERADGTQLPPIKSMACNSSVNNTSNMRIQISDDPGMNTATGAVGLRDQDYTHFLNNIFTGTVNDWMLLLFNGGIDRPLWWGFFETMHIKQGPKSRTLTLAARDPLGLLDRQVPLWELGQGALNDDEQGKAYWTSESAGFNTAFYLGVAPLKTLRSTVGLDKDDSYAVRTDQRTQLFSGHPIQMYNNEDTFGPNDIENEYEGIGVIGFSKKNGAGGNTVVFLSGNPSYSASDTVNIINSTNYNATGISPSSVATVSDRTSRNMGTWSSIQTLEFASGTLGYTADSAKFVYAGKYLWNGNGKVSANNSVETGEYAFIFTSDPGLTVGDRFIVPENTLGTTTNMSAISNKPHRVLAVRKRSNRYKQFTNPGSTLFANNFRYRYNLDLHSDTPTTTELWVVVTNTPYGSGTEYGSINETFDTVASHNSASGNAYSLTTLTLADASAFPSSGSATIYDNPLSQTDSYQYFTWTGKSSNQLTGVTGIFGSPRPGTKVAITGALLGNDRGIICKETAQVNPITASVADISSRAVHARWMRDLSKSLWFKYHFGVIANTPDATGTTQASVTSGDATVRIASATYSAIGNTSGLAEIINSDGTADTFVWRGKATTGGNYYLIGCSFISKSHNSGATINILDTSEDFKHCWLLWADMRNDGTANADGGKRKKDFGIIEPTVENYEIDLFYVDQTDDNGNPDVFTDLKLGQDVDVWEVDATTDPTTSGAWSKPPDHSTNAAVSGIADASGALRLTVSSGHGVVATDYIHVFNSLKHDGLYEVSAVTSTTITLGSGTYVAADAGNTGGIFFCKVTGSETDLATYHDWEDKAGAFLVVDSSKFFNLNTTTNFGKSGQDSGGRTDLGDYVTAGRGFPTLIDPYWREAMANYLNVEAPYDSNKNQFRVLANTSTSDRSIANGDMHIKIDSGQDFPFTGVGRVIGFSGTAGSNQTITTNYIQWVDTLMTEYSAAMSAVTVNANDYEIYVSGADFSNLVPLVINSIFTDADHFPYVTNVTNGEVSIVVGVSMSSYPSSGWDTIKVAKTSLTAYLNNYPNITGWASNPSGDTFEIAKQLVGVFGTSLASKQNLTSASPLAIEEAIQEEFAQYATPRITFPTMTVSSNPSASQYSELQVVNSVSSPNLTRLQMRIRGFVESPNQGTYYESDKMRMLWNAALMKTWLPRTRLSCIHDIANVPNTTIMTADGSTTASSQDDFGSVVNGRTKTVLAIVKASQQNTGVGRTNGVSLNFSYLAGRDGRIELRPSYNIGYSFDRSNLMVSDMQTSMAGQVSHVRVYYNAGTAFVDHPTPSLSDTTRWKIIEKPSIINHAEALSLAKKELQQEQNSRLSITAEPIRSSTETDKMLSGGRFGYIADTHRVLDHHDGQYGYDWAHVAAGFTPFPGMVNGMDGNLKTSTDIYHRYGQSAPYTSISASSAADIEYTDQYYFYGANSVSNAIQIVHIPQDMPYVSDTTNNELRAFVGLKPSQSGTDIDNAEFVIVFVDYEFSNAATANGYTSTTVGSFDATRRGESYKFVKNSGFYEMEVPSSYSSTLNSAGAKIIVSFNAEYCRALLRHRCGDPTASSDILENAHALTGVSTGYLAGGNVNSIFPLGGRKYSEFGDFAYGRSEWYAPRIHVVNDVKFVPGTFVTYTDKGLDLSSQTMAIQQVNWSVQGQKTEKLTLKLERDEGFSAAGVVPYIASMGISPRTGTASNGRGWIQPDPPGGWGGGPPGLPPEVGPLPSDPHNPLPGIPTGGMTPGRPTGGGDFTTETNANNLTAGAYGNMKGRMGLQSDSFSNQSSFSILGQNKPSPTPGSMRPSTGENMNIGPKMGSAIQMSDGMGLPGVGNTDNTGSSKSSISGITEVPIDVMNNQVNVTALISCGVGSDLSQKVTLDVTVKCLETDTTLTNSVTVGVNVDKTLVELMPTILLDGADTYGNTIEVTVERKPGEGSDNANHTALKIHSMKTLFKRSAFMTKSIGSEFKTFS